MERPEVGLITEIHEQEGRMEILGADGRGRAVSFRLAII